MYRGITWQVRSARISQRDFCCRRILWRRMSRESFIFMMRIILHSICTTAVWSILEDMLQNGTVISETYDRQVRRAFQQHVTLQHRPSPRSQVHSMADRVFHLPIWHRLYRSAVKNTASRSARNWKQAGVTPTEDKDQ